MTYKINRPMIAITPSYKGARERGQVCANCDYLNAVWESGGMPVFLAWCRADDEQRLCEYVEEFDGFLFGGGVDIDPHIYGDSEVDPTVNICAERDEFELALFKKAYESGKPIFGICRGIQLINVAMGGTLYQNIDGHRQDAPSNEETHEIELAAGTNIADIVPELLTRVNSFHHQVIKELAPALRITALSRDGYVEAVESLEKTEYGLRIEAVQWHPELIFATNDVAKKLIKGFVTRCALSAAIIKVKEMNAK